MVEYYQRQSAGEPLEMISKPGPHGMVWTHVVDANLQPSVIAATYGLNSNIIRDVLDVHELARAEYKDGVEYIFLPMPQGPAEAADSVPLLLALSPKRLISLSTQPVFSPKHIEHLTNATTDQPSSFVGAVIAGAVTQYQLRLRSLAANINDARHRLDTHEVQNADFIEFVAIEQGLNEYRGSLEGIQSVVSQLQFNRHQLFSVRDSEGLEDISLHIKQLLVSISSSSQTISSIQNAYSTISNNVLNQRMKFLTAITILLAIPNVFYGMYGMNISLPFQTEWWAYPGIAGFTLLLILLVYVVAKRVRLF